METYNGLVRTPTDAIILFEACRLGLLPRVQRRLSEKERQSIRSGSVFVWDEREAGMRRWTDGKSWSASRVSGSFLTYREMEGKRGNSFTGSAATTTSSRAAKTPDSSNDGGPQDGEGEDGPDGYRYKPDGLMKQSFSITTSTGQHLHLISYYARIHSASQSMRQPSNDPSLASIIPPKGMYPESTVNDQNTMPAVTRSPMAGAPNYVMVPQPVFARPGAMPPQAYLPPGYIPHPAYMYPLSPMHTPPGHYAIHPYPPHSGLPPMAYPGAAYIQSPPPIPVNQAPPSSYDQRPSHTSELGGPETAQPSDPSSNSTAPSYPSSHPPLNHVYPSPHYPPSHVPPGPRPDSHSDLANSPPLIDPRLMAESQSRPVNLTRTETNPPATTTNEPTTTSASQVPNIGALVNSIGAVSSDTKMNNERPSSRQGSRSPGGTTHNAPPQDIPSEKLGFREDKRALSKLDRVFARV